MPTIGESGKNQAPFCCALLHEKTPPSDLDVGVFFGKIQLSGELERKFFYAVTDSFPGVFVFEKAKPINAMAAKTSTTANRKGMP